MGQLRRAKARGLVALAFAGLLAGCDTPVNDDVAETTGALVTANALSANALSANALSANALSANALSANALSANALSANALTATALRDPLAREFLKYVVSCALADDAAITVTVDRHPYTFKGQLGLATEWGASHGSCDRHCQRWVSACVLARVDFAGVERLISLRGDHHALRTTTSEVRDYPVREATYYGNVFAEGQKRYLCLSPGVWSDDRVCGPSLRDCPMSVMGWCSLACRHQASDGTFSDCATMSLLDRRWWTGDHSSEDTIDEAITVFLPR